MAHIRKHSKKWFVTILCIALVVMIISQFVAVNVKGLITEAGGCISIAFDKHAMRRADRIVLHRDNISVTITDESLVHELSNTLMVADKTDLKASFGNDWIEIHDGDQLIRRMRWGQAGHINRVEVYKADPSHWIWPSTDQQGLVFLSDELAEKLTSIIEANS